MTQNFVLEQCLGMRGDLFFAGEDVGFWRCINLGCWERVNFDFAPQFLDLSPLAKFCGKGRAPKHWGRIEFSWDETLDGDRFLGADGHDYIRHQGGYWSSLYTPELLRMYGWPIDTDTPEPPKSPQDKALDEFIAKRKAKRDNAKRLEDAGAHTPYEQTTRENERAKAVDRAMNKLAPHALTIHERLMATKGCELT